MRLEYKALAAGTESGLLTADEQSGVVEAIVSVTGLLDSDGDIIEPGAYADTLKRRRPKGIFSHDWTRWASKTETIEEWLPGDPRLPATMKNGSPWPPEAGALWVRAKFNLATTTGRDAFSDVQFYGPECEWSIGYRVPKGKAVRDKQGRRRIKGVDLFEYSQVLFGAQSATGTLAIKGGSQVDGSEEDYEPIAGKTAEPSPGEADAAQYGDGDGEDSSSAAPPGEESPEASGGVASGAGTAGEGAADEGNNEGEDEDDRGQGQDSEESRQRDEETHLHAAAGLLDADELAAGAEHAPDDENDAEGGEGGESKAGAPGVADTPSDQEAVRRLKRWYLRGEGAARIRWGTEGSFRRCLSIAREHMDEQRAKGFCANLYHEATGRWPGRPRGDKSAQGDGQDVESDRYPYLPGTYEDLRQQIKESAAKVLTDLGELTYAEVVATWPGHAVVTVYPASDGGAPEAKSFEVPYSLDEAGLVRVDAGRIAAVELEAQAQDEDGALLPYPGMLDDVAAGVKALLVHGKAGRVLSGRNEKRLVAAVENLVAVLASAGLEVSPPSRKQVAPVEPGGTVTLDPALVERARLIQAEVAARQ